ncbi:hypothetical protein [Clostridium estertheticum]|uniref:hypothetical protein n=1 Tax=Clostridium estertheticum TaxID=238834 RepID=UPI001CF3ABC1|nr:hypothetical protein [Clostridium estertheticum]MCB2358094.1 hypothetical protein [Clostridium estertheticum]
MASIIHPNPTLDRGTYLKNPMLFDVKSFIVFKILTIKTVYVVTISPLVYIIPITIECFVEFLIYITSVLININNLVFILCINVILLF